MVELQADNEELAAEPDLIAHLALIGRHTMLPSIKPVAVNGTDMLVQHRYMPTVIDAAHGVEVDVADCTVFTVHHKARWPALDLEDVSTAMAVLDDSLVAISEVVLWERAHEQMGTSSPFQRCVGRVDVKFFSINGPHASVVMWRNPLYSTNLDGMAMAASFLGNVVMINGPAANPLPPDAKRLMSAIDLVNLGFFTEAFVAAFALVDDLTQRVLAGGLARKGFPDKERQRMLRAIKEERLDHFLNGLARLCDWVALSDANPDLNTKILKVNALRNKVMHGDRELTRSEALEAIATLVDIIVHLAGNPFAVDVTGIPPLRPAEPQLIRMPDVPHADADGPSTEGGTDDRR